MVKLLKVDWMNREYKEDHDISIKVYILLLYCINLVVPLFPVPPFPREAATTTKKFLNASSRDLIPTFPYYIYILKIPFKIVCINY